MNALPNAAFPARSGPTAIAGLSRLDVRILVARTIHDLRDLATDHVMIGGVLPSHLVMPQVDLAVTTGGPGQCANDNGQRNATADGPTTAPAVIAQQL